MKTGPRVEGFIIYILFIVKIIIIIIIITAVVFNRYVLDVYLCGIYATLPVELQK